MPDQPPGPCPCPESRTYRHRDAMRVGTFAGSGISAALAAYLLSQTAAVSTQLTELLKQVSDQGHQIQQIRQVQDDLHRQMDRDRLVFEARVAAGETRVGRLEQRLGDRQP